MTEESGCVQVHPTMRINYVDRSEPYCPCHDDPWGLCPKWETWGVTPAEREAAIVAADALTQVTRCVHCGRPTRNYAGGYASIAEEWVCHPNEPGRPDCYHLATVYKHQLRDCPECTPKAEVAS